MASFNIPPKESLKLETHGLDTDRQLAMEEAAEQAMASGDQGHGWSNDIKVRGFKTTTCWAHFSSDGKVDFLYFALLKDKEGREAAYARQKGIPSQG